MRISAHLCFDGSCEAAFRFYQRVLGGTLQTLLTYGDSPLAERTPPHLRGRILHATLRLDECDLFGADLLPEQHRPAAGFFVLLSVEDVDRGREIFTALAQGGEVLVPFERTFWSPGFGALVDRFGTPWEVSCEGLVG